MTILIGPQTDCNCATLKYAKLLLTLKPILVLRVHLWNEISLQTSDLSHFPNELLLKYSKKRHSHRFFIFWHTEPGGPRAFTVDDDGRTCA